MRDLPATADQILFTPAQAAALLQVRETWLRRRAARRLVPCTFLGKHLRFSRDNLEQIAADAVRPASTASESSARSSGPRGGRSAYGHRRGRSKKSSGQEHI
ncbi:helix-turn-helix domain-containing protein [Lentzea pudingi]|uniref:helix-turn-helix domain-containing protein n=1 Tax=Lentzea pudingi TaxID=1789439 RepID=UPI003570C679